MKCLGEDVPNMVRGVIFPVFWT